MIVAQTREFTRIRTCKHAAIAAVPLAMIVGVAAAQADTIHWITEHRTKQPNREQLFARDCVVVRRRPTVAYIVFDAAVQRVRLKDTRLKESDCRIDGYTAEERSRVIEAWRAASLAALVVRKSGVRTCLYSVYFDHHVPTGYHLTVGGAFAGTATGASSELFTTPTREIRQLSALPEGRFRVELRDGRSFDGRPTTETVQGVRLEPYINGRDYGLAGEEQGIPLHAVSSVVLGSSVEIAGRCAQRR